MPRRLPDFAEFLAGSGIFAIAESLTRDGIPTQPVRARPARNGIARVQKRGSARSCQPTLYRLPGVELLAHRRSPARRRQRGARPHVQDAMEPGGQMGVLGADGRRPSLARMTSPSQRVVEATVEIGANTETRRSGRGRAGLVAVRPSGWWTNDRARVCASFPAISYPR
jgi:hypothetical protein